MATVAPPISSTVARNAPLRPARSPIRPNTKAPSGRNRNPVPNSARAAANPAASGRPEKKVLEMTPVRLPKTKKSYHSNVVPAEDAATTVRRDAGLASAVVAAVSAMRCLSPQRVLCWG